MVGLWVILGWFKKFVPTWKRDFLTLLLFGMGSVFLSWAIVVSHYLSINKYRVWIIQGPAPFDQMGGGPYMLSKYIGWMILGFGLIVMSLVKLRSQDKRTKEDS